MDRIERKEKKENEAIAWATNNEDKIKHRILRITKKKNIGFRPRLKFNGALTQTTEDT